LEGMGQSTVIDANETPENCIRCENVENVTIKSITAKNTGEDYSEYYSCILLENVTNCVVADCKVVNGAGHGINLTQSTNCKIVNNICNNNGNAGIYLGNSSSDNTISGNTCNNNDFYGINLDNSNNNTVTSNTCNNNGNYGIRSGNSSSDNTISGNTCNNNQACGILSNSNNSTITENTCNNN